MGIVASYLHLAICLLQAYISTCKLWFISQGYEAMSGGLGNVAYPITPIMADFPISAPSIWIGNLATPCHLSDRHPTWWHRSVLIVKPIDRSPISMVKPNSYEYDKWYYISKNISKFKHCGPFHLIYTPPYGREFLRGFEKAISEGLCASASFNLCVFSEG
jgi:hypothetical protein